MTKVEFFVTVSHNPAGMSAGQPPIKGRKAETQHRGMQKRM